MRLKNHFGQLGPCTFAFHRAKLVVENGPWRDASPICSLLFAGREFKIFSCCKSDDDDDDNDAGGGDDDDGDDEMGQG